MRNILTVMQYTLKEALTRKVFLAFFIISSLTILGIVLTFAFNPVSSIIPPEIAQDGKPGTPYYILLTGFIIAPIAVISGLGVLLSIFSTAGLITSMMERGTIDLFLSKPISRTQLMLGRISGSLLMVLVNLFYLIFGLWLSFGLFTGYYNFYVLTALPIVFYQFASLFSVIVLVGVMTKSSIPGMMTAYFIYIIGSPLIAKKDGIIEFLNAGGVFKAVLNFFYYIIPQVDGLTSKVMFPLIMENKIIDVTPLIQNAVLILVFLGIALFIFEKKEL
ncbi:MAG: ABC transporter permease [Ignavibacteriaceae bacterium]|nr:ABC transporter permease [Ignavibacteriaceae bacterium]